MDEIGMNTYDLISVEQLLRKLGELNGGRSLGVGLVGHLDVWDANGDKLGVIRDDVGDGTFLFYGNIEE